jgi:hypothetical protein
VSLLKKAGLRGHLDDGGFAEIWSASVLSGEAASDPHLDACQQCRSRYEAFTGWLSRIQEDARGEADEAFSADRLATQQAQIMRRLEALERPARVIAFPKFARPITSTHGHAQRWVATAAAAGLVIGLAAGQFLDIRDAFSVGRQGTTDTMLQTAARNDILLPAVQIATPAPFSSVSDEALFFGESEKRVRLATLESVDVITPRGRDLDLPR